MNAELLVEVTRGGWVESRHDGHAVVVDKQGQIVAALGDPGHVSFLRSSLKPFQALAVVASGAPDAFGFTDAEIALMCGSHAGEPEHVAAATSMLAKLGLGPDHLACGPHPLTSPAARRALAETGMEPTRVHNNCSGKHAGMLALARHRGWPVEGYHRPDHPVQQEVRALVAALTGLSPGGPDWHEAVDGCGVVTFALPLVAVARMFRYLGRPDLLPADLAHLAPALDRIRRALVAHPTMIRGAGQFDTEVIRATGGAWIGKVGAEGYYAAGLATGHALALKIADGQDRARPVAVLALLERFGLLPPGAEALKERWARVPVTNTRGEVVGEIRPAGRLAAGL
ncbi:L-asparaginase II [Thermaerobacter marianensis DSM 12885]|uniref:L-asparaginase II n=1 Tax=Thermaerobacter marianensis (strain ATCC 700841 / DSM 12885 / JCM 10246 / 7p75a) TaxID=644966 RepID=E6SM59_THEM7|nr:asparaginase [Thermaerobacter marianensis]ADU50389.1 L-asparaginase II [Thermaerobacter marianensis DSM 12885]